LQNAKAVQKAVCMCNLSRPPRLGWLLWEDGAYIRSIAYPTPARPSEQSSSKRAIEADCHNVALRAKKVMKCYMLLWRFEHRLTIEHFKFHLEYSDGK
jgi:hypothetical protein